MYSCGIKLGYFIAAVDYRYRLDKALGTLPPDVGAPPDKPNKASVRLL
jgi:hypothetical protein